MLEDESDESRTGSTVDEMLVTGCIVAVMGTENGTGFEVVDITAMIFPATRPVE